MDETTKYVTWDVYREIEKRMDSECQRQDDENNRQNHRLDEIEGNIKQIAELVTSVKLLAANMDAMAKEQAKQGDRLTLIEQKPEKRWETVVTGVLAAIVGAIGAAIAAGIFH